MTAVKLISIVALAGALPAMAAGTFSEKLGNGAVEVYSYADGTRIHAFMTGDPLGDVVMAVEGRQGIVAIESPAFAGDFGTWSGYLEKTGKKVTSLILSDHPSDGKGWYGGAVVRATETSWKAINGGSVRAISDGLGKVFGGDFDLTVPAAYEPLKTGPVTLEGIEMQVLPNGDGIMIVMPAQKAAYLHMMGSDTHSIVASGGHADYQASQLELLKKAGIETVFTSHHAPESAAVIDGKIKYLQDVKAAGATAKTGEEFIKTVQKAYPDLLGVNYLEMSAGIMFPAK